MRIMEFALSMFSKNTGDVISVCPHDHKWGARDISEYLIILVETTLLPSELRKKFDWQTDRVNAKFPFRYKVELDEIKAMFPELDTKKAVDTAWRYQPLIKLSRFDYFIPENKNRVIDPKFIDCGDELTKTIEKVVPYGSKIFYDKDRDIMISVEEMEDIVVIDNDNEKVVKK